MEDTVIIMEPDEDVQAHTSLPLYHPSMFMLHCHRCESVAGFIAEGYSWCRKCYNIRRGKK